ncbi:glutathione S-transferase family protein [Sphingobium subterraneum]|uniref:Glutathione S-transferase n=1 Tax=Sphingobium subterraneum TaxID=627688 RepID=A0A841J2D1_9SPHN|nr:glutathione S-transferase family protein [Sphingobium subterraneum]MBB6124977.1 glutathione S-transferase [Sphingobium subterraneum]
MLELIAHPFSSYCQKVLIALYENATPFTYRPLSPDSPENGARLQALSPSGKFPVLIDAGEPVLEATIIIEHLQLRHPGPVALIPADAEAALPVRMLDRMFDNYVMAPMQQIVGDSLRPMEARDPAGVAQAKAMLDRIYAWLDQRIGDQDWACGARFTLADCAAAPSLFYADWAVPIEERFAALRAYRARLLARPSFARCVEEARPYRHLFPLGAPDRD